MLSLSATLQMPTTLVRLFPSLSLEQYSFNHAWRKVFGGTLAGRAGARRWPVVVAMHAFVDVLHDCHCHAIWYRLHRHQYKFSRRDKHEDRGFNLLFNHHHGNQEFQFDHVHPMPSQYRTSC